MPGQSHFVTHVLDLLEGLGTASARAMFGAHGIYVDGLIVGLVEDDTLFLKVDDQNRPRFEEAGGRPFTYHDKAGQPRTMAYWTVPEHVLDDAGAMVEWARTSLEAALRAKAPAKKAAAARAPKRAAAAPAAKTAAKTAGAKSAAAAKAKAKPAAKASAPRARTAPSATAAARATKPRRKS